MFDRRTDAPIVSQSHRVGITAVDVLAAPLVPVPADVATGGTLLAGTTYKAAVAARTGAGPTTPSPVASQATAADASNTHMIRVPIPQTVDSIGYDLFLSTDAAPKYAAFVTEAQRAAGGRILAVGGPCVGDEAADVATKMVTALTADTDVGGFFTVTGSGANVILTAKAKAANDATLNAALANGTCAGLTAAPTSADTTPGVAPVLQVETATIVGTITLTGNATITVTAAGMSNSPKAVSVAVVNLDTATAVATKVRAALALDADVSAFFTISGAGANIILTAKTAAANDGTMNVASANGTCTGLTAQPTSANTTAGVAGTLQVETATVVGNISQSGNATVTVTAAGMSNSPKVVQVAVSQVAGTPGAIDIGVVGTGAATNAAPFLNNNAYDPGGVTPINCGGYSQANALVKLATDDLRSQPSCTVAAFGQFAAGGDWYLMGSSAITLGGALAPLESNFEFNLYGAINLVVLVTAIAGQGAAVTINVVLG